MHIYYLIWLLHPFLDGNKRTATAATDILNGYYIDLHHEEIVKMMNQQPENG
ncbi:MAG: Fic family protein [Candidatus Nitrosocaldus sp.]